MKTDATAGVLGIVNKYVAGLWQRLQPVHQRRHDLRLVPARCRRTTPTTAAAARSAPPGYNNNQWHHVGVRRGRGGRPLYVDGQQHGSVGWTGIAGGPTTTQDVHVAHYPGAFGGVEYLFGAVDDVRIYDRALSAAEVSSLYTSAPAADTTAPSVALTSPGDGTTVFGTITVTASASDNVGVAGVQFTLDGVNLGTEDTVAPYAVTWNTMTASNGPHTLSAVARDAATNTTTAATVTVAVANDVSPPVISGVTATSVTIFGATIAWTTNEAADTQIEYGLTTAYGMTTALDTSLVTSHSQTLSGLIVSTLYHFRVKSRDAAGNLAMSGDFTVTTLLTMGDLVAHWKFDDGAGTIAGDASGNGRTGTLVNGPGWTAGHEDGGLTFNGTTQFVSAAHASALNRVSADRCRVGEDGCLHRRARNRQQIRRELVERLERLPEQRKHLRLVSAQLIEVRV